MSPAFFGFQNHSFSKNPILIIDRDGLIGKPLSLKLSKEFLVIFVSRNSCANVPFSGKFPVIPDNKYSHIIFIDEEGQDLELLPRIIKKAKDVNADFIFAQGVSLKGECAVNKILRLCPSAKVILFGDIFDSKLILRKENFKSVINNFILQAQKFGKIQISGDGLRDTYPVFLNDVVDGLVDLMFGIYRSHSLFYIFPKHPSSELSLAHMIQKINPEIMVDFIKHAPSLERITYPPNGKNLLGDKYPIVQKIRGIDIKKSGEAQDESLDKNKKRLRNFPFFIIWALIFLLLFPLIFTSFFSSLGLNTLDYAKREMDRGNFANIKSSLHLSQTFFYLGKQILSILSFQAKIAGAENDLKRLSLDLDLGYKISDGILQAFNSGTYFSKVLTGKSENPSGDFAKAQSYLKSSIIALDKAKAEGNLPPPALQNLKTINSLTKLLSSASEIMPSIFGMEKPKTYLILFQNNLELRPGGGLISSYGILKFNLGKITQFSMHDVSDADKQLRGHVEPPFALRRYLPSTHGYMRDSNFDVDFIKSALSASNFLLAETGQKVSGVVSIDTSFVKSILQAIGPVYIADYKETVDENFSLGSMQKKDFLISLNKAIITKMTEKKVPYLLVVQAISDALLQKHLLFAFQDWQNIFTVNGWSSSLWDERKNEEKSVNDFLGINEANLGLNQVNYFISRNVAQKVSIGADGSISEELAISYKNESAIWTGKDYKNYLRIILPKDTKLSGISINDNIQNVVDAVTDPLVYEAKNFKAPDGLEVEKVNQDNKTVYGFIVRVPAGGLVKVKVKYAFAGSTLALDAFSYNLKLFKQPGVDSMPYSFSFTYPKHFNIIKSSAGVSGGEGKISYSEKIAGDKNLIINFAKK